jgi:hypothetical protein
MIRPRPYGQQGIAGITDELRVTYYDLKAKNKEHRLSHMDTQYYHPI